MSGHIAITYSTDRFDYLSKSGSLKHSNSFPCPILFYLAKNCIIVGLIAVLAPQTIGVKGMLALIAVVGKLGS